MQGKLPPEWRELLSLIPGYDSEATADEGDWFSVERATFAISFFEELLQFTEGKTGPFLLEPWQAAIVAALWGWRRADGSRRYRETILYVPRKAGKSPTAAGLALLSFYTDTNDSGRQVYVAGTDKDQAGIIFKHAVRMIEKQPLLANRVRIYRALKSVEHQDGSILRALAGDASSLDGLNSSCVVIDELHAHKNSALVDVLLTSTASRREPLVIFTTTADFARESTCNTKYLYACGVRDGTIRDRAFLPVIYEASVTDDWTDPAVWAKANPNLGVSVSLEYMAREVQRVKAEPSFLSVFQRLHLNIRTGNAISWLSPEVWNACKREKPDLSGRTAYAGMDLSSTQDISAVVLAIPSDDPSEPTWLVPRFFVPEAKLDNKTDRVPYRQWWKDGYLTSTPGNVIDYEFIRAEVNRLAEEYDLQSVRFDPWSAQDLATRMAETDGLPMVAMRQGFASMSAPTREFERRCVAGQLAHDGNPVLAWMLSGAMIVRDPADNMKVTKQKSTTRVDGIVAAIMALAGAMASEGPSVYERRGILTL